MQPCKPCHTILLEDRLKSQWNFDRSPQSFAVLQPQGIQIGTHAVRQVSFVVPMNAIGVGSTPREDGLLPSMTFQRVFITCSGGYTNLESWKH